MKSKSNASPSHEEITVRARALWEQEGRPEGRSAEHWLQAERELRDGLQQAPGQAGNGQQSGVPKSRTRDAAEGAPAPRQPKAVGDKSASRATEPRRAGQ